MDFSTSFESHLQELRLRARTLPQEPGVYFWKDARQKTLYIGKAVDLRARVMSYFSTAQRDSRARELLRRARSIEYEVTATELDALFRESVLIKEELPRFNRMLLQPTPEYWIKIDSSVEDPYLEVSRNSENDGSLYFGPFRSAAVLRETIDFLHAALPLRKCTAKKPRCKPCMYYQMNKCAAPPLGQAHRRRHTEAIDALFDLLDGRSDRVTRWLENKRNRLSDALLFELAAEVQSRLDNLRVLLQKQVILSAAIQCRCVLIHQDATKRSDARLLLVAHGSVVSFRSVADATLQDIVQWLRAHAPIIRAAERKQGELDAAMVLQRWLSVNRSQVRWAATPPDANDLPERVQYVIGLQTQEDGMLSASGTHT